jgi:hypothetical protein
MSELIAIPLESDRRAVEVLAALRWLQAEYECRGDAPPTATAADDVARAVATNSANSARRRVRLRLAFAAFVALVLGAWAAGQGLLNRVSELAARPEGVTALRASAFLGLLLFIAAAPFLLRALDRRPRHLAGAAPKATWLVSYLIRDPAAAHGRRVRATILQITLPAEAEGRLKAILARADATAAR